MANYANLLATIAANIYTNGNNEVTAAMVKTAVDQMVASLGAGYQFMGVATPTSPGTAQTPDQKVFYIASTPGTYTYLGGLVVNDGEVAVFKYNGTWSKEVTGAATAAQVTKLGQKVGDIQLSTLWSSSVTPGPTQTSRVLTIPSASLPDKDTYAAFYFTGAAVNRIRFFADSSYTLISEFYIDRQGQVVTFPHNAYSMAIYFPAGAPYTTVKFEHGDACQQLAELSIKTDQNTFEIESRNKTYGAPSAVIFPASSLSKGFIDNNGDYQDNSNRICTDYIFIGNGKAFNIVASNYGEYAAYVNIFVYAYKNYYGKRVFSRNIYPGGKYGSAVVHLQDDEDSVRVWIQFMDSSFVVISNPDISKWSDYMTINSPAWSFQEQDNTIEIGRKLQLDSTVISWVIGDLENYDSKKRSIANLLRVKEGHRYMLTAKSKGDISNVSFDVFDGSAWSHSVVSYNSGVPAYNAVFDAPKGSKLMAVSIFFYNVPTDIYNLDDYEIVLYDTTLDDFCFSTKQVPLVASGSRYAQGMDIDNGYIFQAFANGEIDIYRLDNFDFVQTMSVPTVGGNARHLGVVKFGDKYDPSDDFRLLWVGGDNGSYSAGLRIVINDGVFSCTEAEIIDDSTLPGEAIGFDFVNNQVIRLEYSSFTPQGQYARSEGYAKLHIYDVSSWDSPGSLTLNKTINICDAWAVQMLLVQGKEFYIPVGVGVRAMNLFIVNSVTEVIEQIIDLTQLGIPVEEPQSICFYDGKAFLSTVKGIYLISL